MTPPKKPEWFELTEGDGVKPRASVKRSVRGVLLALPILLIGVGVVVAQGTDESPASAETVTTVASAVPEVKAVPNVASAKPSIATPPTLTNDDDEDEEGDDRNHKRGERHHNDDDEGDDD
jgi:hypothetical protein